MIHLSLDCHFPLDVKCLADYIESLTLEDAIFGRYGGIRCTSAQDYTDIVAWQCNLADAHNSDIKLPTIVKLRINKENYVVSADLHENFKGSQGMPCLRVFLNNRMKKLILIKMFDMNNPIFRDQTAFYCRHVYELVFGACAFYEYSQSIGLSEGYISEITGVYSSPNDIKCFDRTSINGKSTDTQINIKDYVDSISYNASGAIERVNGLKLSGYSIEDMTVSGINSQHTVFAESAADYVMKMMKLLAPYWKSSGDRLGVNRKFYFSQLWPPSFLGILSNALALSTFNKNYTYLQHCAYGLQHSGDGKPLCIGVINNINEGQKYFEDLTPEDFFVI